MSIIGGDLLEGLGSRRAESAGSGGQLRQGHGLLDGLMRMLGMDSDKLGVMALNALIYLAEWVSGRGEGE